MFGERRHQPAVVVHRLAPLPAGDDRLRDPLAVLESEPPVVGTEDDPVVEGPDGRVAAAMSRVFPALVLILMFHTLFSSMILEQTLQVGLGVRIAIAVLLLSALGFLMGIPFPVGIRWIGRRTPSVVPWLWGINGVTSVLGSALATALSIHIGFGLTMGIATLVYSFAGLLFIFSLSRSASEPDVCEPPLPGQPGTTGLEPA